MSSLPNAASAAPPPTIIVVHSRENRRKCSVEPLRSDPRFLFWTWPARGVEPLDRYVRLGIGGPLLSPADQSAGLFVLDANWKLAPRMERQYAELPVRSLPPYVTAYPRAAKDESDPHGGLATIEAIHAAFVELGRDPTGLLDRYRWADEFLARNAALREAAAARLAAPPDSPRSAQGRSST